MSDGTSIIQAALKKIGAHSVASPASPQAVEDGREMLNSMMEMWLSRGIILGVTPLKSAGDELNEPNDARNAIVFNLSLLLAPDFANGKQIVTQDLRNAAKDGFVQVRSLYGAVVIPDKIVSSTLPVGEGNKIGFGERRTYFPQGSKIEN